MKKRRIIIYIGMLIVGILFSSMVVARYSRFYKKELSATLNSVAEVAAVDVQTDRNLQTSLNEILDDCVDNLVGFCSFSFKENQYSKPIMDELYTQIKAIGYVYYMHAICDDENQTAVGTFLSANGEPGCILNEEELYELCTTGEVVCDDFQAKAMEVEAGYYAVITWNPDSIVAFEDSGQIITAEYGETILYIRKTEDGDKVYSANYDEYLNKDVKDILGNSVNIDELLGSSDTMTINMKDRTRSLVTAMQATDDEYVLVFLPVSSINLDMARSILLPNLLFWLVLIFMTHFILEVLRDNSEDENDGAVYHRVGKKYCIERRMSSHIGASVIFGMVLILLLVTYSQTLVNYSNQNMKANSNLHNLEEIIKNNEANVEGLTSLYEYCNSLLTEAIATYYMEHPETLNDDSLNRLLDRMPHCNDITLYDREGTSEYTTGTFKGYTLSHDESSMEYGCWDIIEGKQNVLLYGSPSEDYYIVGRRQDKGGLVRLLVDADEFDYFIKMMSIDETVLRTGFGRATKIYTLLTDSSKLRFIEDDSNEIRLISNSLPEEAMTDGYAGIERIEGVKYYINTSIYNDYILICAERIHNIRGLGVGYIVRIVIICFLMTYILFTVLSLRKVELMQKEGTVSKNKYEIAHSLEEQLLDDRFKQMLRNMVVFSGVVLVALLGIDAISSKNSLLTYLFSSEWSHGINMFSVTMILIVTVIGIVFSIVMRTFIIYVTQNMGPRGLTIGRMISSLMKLAVLIAVITKTLMYLGVNPAALLAGAGIAGAMISFCAQQTVNDLLSGFFIVFEGVFNIGDWIKVDGFRGQVVEIGVRTTKVAIGNNIQIINNSELKKITIMAKNSTGAICDVDIAYKEDAGKVIKLLGESAKTYQSLIPEIVEGPYVDGVVELGASGVTIRMWAIASQEDVLKVERQMRKVTKQIFDTNNIEIPFTQVTIHTDTD